MSLATIKTAHTGRDVALLVLCLSVLLVGAELATRRLLIPASRIERQIDSERQSITSVASPMNSVLIVGNSLVQDGVNAAQMNKLTENRPAFVRYAIAQTVFADWRYGLEAILASPAAPRFALILMSPDHFASRGGRGDYSALRLMGTNQLLPYVRSLEVHPTEASRLVFSHVSAYYGFRNELRKNLLGRVLPDVPLLMQRLNVRSPERTPLDTALLRLRFAELRSVGARYGKQVLVGSPPLLGEADRMLALCEAAKVEKIPCVLPRNLASYTTADFHDGYHLGPTGTERFSADLAIQLRSLVRGGDKPVIAAGVPKQR